METHLRVYENFFHTSLAVHERTALSMSSAIPWATVPDQFKRIQVGWAQTFISRCFPTAHAMLPAASVACCHIFSIGMTEVSPSQDHNNGWAGVGATERTGTEGT